MATVSKLSVTLPPNIADELSHLATELNEKKSHIIEEALSYYFDVLDTRLAEKRLQEIEDGTVKTVSGDDVFKALGI